MSYCYALADHGRTLATRPFGEELREDLVAKAEGQDAVVLDFSAVASTSHSFADEFVAQLVEEAKHGNVGFDVSMRGASEEVERVIRRALERRGVDFAVPA